MTCPEMEKVTSFHKIIIGRDNGNPIACVSNHIRRGLMINPWCEDSAVGEGMGHFIVYS
jgi:hypothetical protein